MSASKKTASKSTKSPAPATKTVPAPKPAPAAAKKATRPAVQTAAPAPASVATVAPRPAKVATAPAVKPVAPKPITTAITARVDVGFGNTLYIRGEGTGLTWDKGLPMECVGTDLWRVVLEESARGFVFKFLVNDIAWSTGPDYSTSAGTSVTLTPEF